MISTETTLTQGNQLDSLIPTHHNLCAKPLVVFERPTRNDPAPAACDAGAQDLSDRFVEDELASTREHLQTLMEEMAASNEEMQALNEEVQASNEELQATNEELEASNEELQATNEELVSVNEESLIKSAELSAINSDFEGVYNTIDFPIMVFDPELFLKRANGAAIRTYDLPPSSAGMHISRLKLPAFLDTIGKNLSTALSDQRKDSFEITSGKHTFQVFVTPVVNPTGSPKSVVLVVVDHTDLVEAQERIRESQERLLSIMNHSTSAVSLKDAAGYYEFVNLKFEEVFSVKASDVIGKTDQQLFDRDIALTLRSRELDVMRQLSAIEAVDKFELGAATVWLEFGPLPHLRWRRCRAGHLYPVERRDHETAGRGAIEAGRQGVRPRRGSDLDHRRFGQDHHRQRRLLQDYRLYPRGGDRPEYPHPAIGQARQGLL